MRKIIILAVSLIFVTLFSVVVAVSAANHQRLLDEMSTRVTPYSAELFSLGSEITITYEAVVDFEVESMVWSEGETIDFQVEIPQNGQYAFVINYIAQNNYFESNRFDLYINGTLYSEAINIVLPSRYVFVSHERNLNSRGLQIYPVQHRQMLQETTILRTGTMIPGNGILNMELTNGLNEFSFYMNQGSILLTSISLIEYTALVTHDQYLQQLTLEPTQTTDIIILEAEHFYYKSELSIGVSNRAGTNVSPYVPEEILLNVINGDSFRRNGQRIAYFIEIEQPGLYQIGLRATTTGKIHMPVFVDIEINHQIPFNEFKAAEIPFSNSNSNFLFENTPVFLEAGIHEIAFVINNKIYGQIAAEIALIAHEINQLGLELQRLTGNNQDPNREWVIEEFLPNIVTDMTGWHDQLVRIETELNIFTNGHSNEEISHVRVSMDHLQRLIDSPNEIPFRMPLLNQGANSAFQRLQSVVLTLNEQPLEIDQIIIAGVDSNREYLPVDNGNWALAIRDMFHHALTVSSTRPATDGEDVLEVWIRRPQQHFDIATNLIESYFMETTGMQVNISLISDQTIVALANMAGRQPDVAIGIDAWYVNDLALRGSLADLRQFPNAQASIENAIPGALLQMIIDDQLFGLPDQQDFQVMFYRRDIFETFDWEIPETWDDILLMLPRLQRNGMNFYNPLASTHALKSWVATMPFYAKFGADIYTEDGLSTLVNSQEGIQAMQFMTDLFMIYGMPKQVGSFFNDFRSGRLPIGVESFSMYALLRAGAPEINGLWGIVPVPGGVNADGEIMHWSTGTNSAVVIFERSERQEQAWQFAEWWVSTENQIRFMTTLQNAYGEEFLWASGNQNALLQLPIPAAHLETIQRQITWIQEAPRIPGGYITEREVSNAFTRVIYGGANVRMAVNQAAIIGNREIDRKMQEFGYISVHGDILRPFQVPTIQQVEGWRRLYE